jgi:hypothetical protein
VCAFLKAVELIGLALRLEVPQATGQNPGMIKPFVLLFRNWFSFSRACLTTDGIPTDRELTEYLKEDAQILGLPAPVPVTKVFDFTMQREVNRELGAK